MLLGDFAQDGKLGSTGIGEHNIELALLPRDLREETIKVTNVRHVSLDAGDIASDSCDRCSQLRLTAPHDENVRAFVHNCFAVASLL